MGCGVGMWMSEWRGWFPIHVPSIRSPSLRAQSRGGEGELNPKHETSKGRYFILGTMFLFDPDLGLEFREEGKKSSE